MGNSRRSGLTFQDAQVTLETPREDAIRRGCRFVNGHGCTTSVRATEDLGDDVRGAVEGYEQAGLERDDLGEAPVGLEKA